MVLSRFYPTLLALLTHAIESFNPNIPTVPAGGSHLVLGGPIDTDCLVADGHEALEILPHGAMAWREPYWPAQNAFHTLPPQLEREIYELVPAPPDPNAPEVRLDSYPRAFVTSSGDIFITGDVDTLRSGIAPPDASWVFRYGFSQSPPELITANFNEERHYGTAVILHMRPEHGNVDRILVFGGSRDKNWPSSPGGPGSDCYTGDPLTEGEVLQSVFELRNDVAAALEDRTWRQKADMAVKRIFHNAIVLPNGLILLVGGTKADYSRPYLARTASCPVEANMNFAPELYDPGHQPTDTGSTTLLAASPVIPPYDLSIPRLYHHLALLLQDGRVLVVGGWQPSTVVPQGTPCENLIPAYPSAEDSGEIFSPPYLDLPYRPTFLRVPPNQVELSAGLDVKQFSCDVEIDPESVVVAVTLLRPAAVTHHFDNDQRYIELAFNVTTNPGGSKKVTAMSPDVTLAPPGFYMVHVVEAPSAISPRQDWSPSNAQLVQFH